MIRYLPRHTFGYMQSKLFPKYFMLGVALSGISLATFLIDNPISSSWSFEQKLQAASHLISFLLVSGNAFYLSPQTTNVMFEKHKLEKEEHAGQAIGAVEEDKAAKLRQNKRYVELERSFSRLHGYSVLFALSSLLSHTVNIWFLAAHLRHT
ncbi:Transmembrane protein 205 [Geodia barretti]|nr:Transmembrane protein 205 [Geodia barretti]